MFIPKEDCIGHVTKRMETALRKVLTDYKGNINSSYMTNILYLVKHYEYGLYPVKYLIHIKFSGKKLEDGKGIGGKGRLTAVRIDALQNFYGIAIRDNEGNATAMSKATHAILKHYSSTHENPRHEDCPSGNESWCSYNRDLATGQTTHCLIQDPLPQAVVNAIQSTFDRLGDKHFLAGCEKCLNQINNESLHHVIWRMSPKEQFISQQEASLAVALWCAGF